MAGEQREIDVVDQTILVKIRLTVIDLPHAREQREIDVVDDSVVIHVADKTAMNDIATDQIIP